jgi:hypothetical protein
MALSIMDVFATLKHNSIPCCSAGCCYAESEFSIMLSVTFFIVVLSVVMLSFFVCDVLKLYPYAAYLLDECTTAALMLGVVMLRMHFLSC